MKVLDWVTRQIASLQGVAKKVNFRFGHFGKQVQLVLGKEQFLRHLILVGGDKPFYILLNQFDRCCSTRLAIIAERAVLSCRKLEGNRMVFVAATFPFLVLMRHNPLI